MKNLQDKVVVLSGASSGIGRCLTKQLVAHGAKLAVCGRSKERLESLRDECSGKHKLFFRAFCLSSEQKILEFVKETEQVVGPIDILINCAGVNSARSNIAQMKTADLEWMTKINLIAPTIFMREVFLRMQLRKAGHVVNVISTVALFSNPGIAAYSASKAGLEAFTKVFRKEARDFGIAVTSVFPGGVDTNFRSKPNADYTSPETVAESIVNVLTMNDDATIHELVLRPSIETNFV